MAEGLLKELYVRLRHSCERWDDGRIRDDDRRDGRVFGGEGR
jgi:hypothetical protein